MSDNSNNKDEEHPLTPHSSLGAHNWSRAAGGDALFTNPDQHRGVILRRIFAYAVDVVILTVISYALATLLVIMSLGLAIFVIGPIIVAIALGYHTFFIGRNAATPGMSFLGLEVRDYYSANKPTYGQAFVASALFYLSVIVTVWIVLLVPLFTRHNRTLHDLLSGTVILRRAL